MDEGNADLLTNYIVANSSLVGLTVLVDSNFNTCVQTAFKIGFKQQSFIVAANVKKLEFWSTNKIKLNDSQSKIDNLDIENIYFLRRTVANAIKQVTFQASNTDYSSFCSFYSKNGENTLCDNFLSETDSLTWHKNDLPSEACENIDVSKIWIPEIHDGPRADFPSTLAYLGQRAILAGHKFFKSPYKEAIQLATVMTKLSDTIKSEDEFKDLNDESIQENYVYYKNDADFKDVDFVICSFYPSLCEAFIPLNKTIIFNPAHRYNLARCSRERWTKLNENLYALRDKSKLIVSSMGRYDAEYLFHFTGLFGYRLYAYGGFYARNVSYNPIQKEILVGPTNNLVPLVAQYITDLNEMSQKQSLDFKFSHIRDLYPKYTLQNLANHRAIVLFPYAVMTYSIIDFYIAKIPLFVPSSKLWKGITDRSIRSAPYCGDVPDIEPDISTLNTFSPNAEDDDAYQYWVKYADFYQWPHVTVFESFEELIEKLNTLDLQKISDEMKLFNYLREADLLSNWCQILKKKDKTATIPNTYMEALSYFNTQEFQV